MKRDLRGPRATARRIAAVLAIAIVALAAPATASAGRVATLVYFVKGEQMQAVPRTIWFGAGGVERAAVITVRKIKEGPKRAERRRGIYSAFDVPLAIRNVKFRNGVATVYAPRGIYAPSPPLGLRTLPASRLRIAQIVYTLTEFPDIKTVTIVTAGPRGNQVRLKNLKRKTFRLPTGPPPNVPLPPWQGPRPGDVKSIKKALVKLHFLPAGAADASADYRLQQVLYAFQGWYGLERSGVADTATVRKLRALSPDDDLPTPARSTSGRHAEVYRDKGVLLLFQGRTLVRAVHISSGAGGATPSGSFSVWLPYASYFTGGIAFHSYPDVPPYPASHGCVRTSAPEAPFVYEFLEYGTPVYVF